MKSSFTGESDTRLRVSDEREIFSSVFSFFFSYSLRFFKKRQQEKQVRRPRRDSDGESVEDVDDEEFEKILGELRSGDR